MKRTLIIASCTLALAGCASAGAGPIDVSSSKLAVATHNDLQAAAKWADDHGYPARAAVWRAHDAHLSAVEAQISACANAIAADLAAMKPADGAPASPFLALEMAAEAAGSFTGPSAKTKITCEPFPVITLPVLPKLP